MLTLLSQLFLQFFHVGVFSFGGGYATLPFLYDIADKFHWYSAKQLTDMLAISSITPGPVGVNVATFAGFTTAGILGSLVATTAIEYELGNLVERTVTKYRTFETTSTTWMDMLRQIAEAFDVIILFDSSNECIDVCHREEFGEETNISLTYDNALNEIEFVKARKDFTYILEDAFKTRIELFT